MEWKTAEGRRLDAERLASERQQREWAEERRRITAAKEEEKKRIASLKAEELKARKKETKKRERAEEREQKLAMAALTVELKKDPKNAKIHSDIGDLALEMGEYAAAKKSYLTALAIGFADPLLEGKAAWGYANLLWTTRRSPVQWLERKDGYEHAREMSASTLGGLARDVRVLSSGARKALRLAVPDVLHQVGVAQKAIRRHLRSDPDDVDALRLMKSVVRTLGQNDAGIQQQIDLARRRRTVTKGRVKYGTDRSGIAFETRCLTVLRSLGFRSEITQATADGGIDIIAFSDNPLLAGRCVVQCKDWSNPVGEPVVRDLLGVVSAEDAIKGILITSGTFTPAAVRFAQGKRIELIDGEDLRRIESLAPAP